MFRGLYATWMSMAACLWNAAPRREFALPINEGCSRKEVRSRRFLVYFLRLPIRMSTALLPTAASLRARIDNSIRQAARLGDRPAEHQRDLFMVGSQVAPEMGDDVEGWGSLGKNRSC